MFIATMLILKFAVLRRLITHLFPPLRKSLTSSTSSSLADRISDFEEVEFIARTIASKSDHCWICCGVSPCFRGLEWIIKCTCGGKSQDRISNPADA